MTLMIWAEDTMPISVSYTHLTIMRIDRILCSKRVFTGLADSAEELAIAISGDKIAFVGPKDCLLYTSLRSTVGRPPASPRRGSSPTNVYTFRRFGA